MNRGGLLRLALGMTLLVAALRWTSLALPLDRDEGAYATMAWAAQSASALPYVDLLDHKPPLLYGIYGFAIRLGGAHPVSIRLFSFIWQALSAIAFATLLWRWSGRSGLAWGGGVAYALLASAWGSEGIGANAEGWGVLPLIAGLALLRPWEKERVAWRWVAWGVAGAVAACIKQPYYVMVLALPLFWPDASRRRAALLWTLVGLAGVHAYIALRYAAVGGPGAWLEAVFSYHRGYGRPWSLGALRGFAGLSLHLLAEQGGLWLLAFLGLSMKGPHESLRRAALILTIGGLVAASLSGRWYAHYWQHLTPGLALGVALFFDRPRRPWALALMVATLALFVSAQSPFWTAGSGAERSRRLFGASLFPQAPAIADWVRTNSGERERLWVWGSEAELYVLARRLPATRQLNHYGVVGVAPPWPGTEDDFMTGLDKARIVVLAEGLDPADALQHRLGLRLQRDFEISRDLFPPAWVGRRRP